MREMEDLARSGPYTDVTMYELAREYSANQFSADAKYKGKALRVSGMVALILTDKDGNPMVSLGPNKNENLAVCFWSGSGTRLRKLSPGDGITVTAVGGGIAANQVPMLGFCDGH